jgi:hypothetical protein
VNGVEHRPFDEASVRAATLIFVLADCPVANGYAPEINRLCNAYAAKGVNFYLVQVDADLTAAEARQHAREYGYTCPVVLDGQQALVKRAGATMVPEVAVFGPKGERFYRGRIDNTYAALGKRLAQATAHDLRDALNAVVAGCPVVQSETQPVGCFIPRVSQKGQ